MALHNHAAFSAGTARLVCPTAAAVVAFAVAFAVAQRDPSEKAPGAPAPVAVASHPPSARAGFRDSPPGMTWIPPGEFVMGDDAESAHERPAHLVRLEPFTEIRVPLLFNLRRDPFERAQHNSNTYYDWFLERVFVIVPMHQLAGQFLMTMKDYPPSQTPGSFNLEKIQKQIEEAASGR